MIKRYISLISGATATAYTVWYMHYGVPYKNEGALSKIGLTHHTEFLIWGILTFAVLALLITQAYRRYVKTKVYIPLLTLSAVGMALTLAFPFDYDIKPGYYFHCAGSLIFSIVTGATVFTLFALCYKKDRIFKIFTCATAVILLTDAVCLLIFKETGLIESVPVFAGYIMLGTVNSRRDKLELKR